MQRSPSPQQKKSPSLPSAPPRKNNNPTGKLTATTMKSTTGKKAKHVEELSSGENIAEERKQLKVEEDSKVVRGNSLVRRGRKRRS